MPGGGPLGGGGAIGGHRRGHVVVAGGEAHLAAAHRLLVFDLPPSIGQFSLHPPALGPQGFELGTLTVCLGLPGAPRRRVVPAPQPDASRLDPKHPTAKGVEQFPVVRDDHPCALEGGESGHEDSAGIGVEVIGGLVDQQHIRIRHQGGAHLPALPLTRG
jgi:hypothetical protein